MSSEELRPLAVKAVSITITGVSCVGGAVSSSLLGVQSGVVTKEAVEGVLARG